jgi:hypothetical protein
VEIGTGVVLIETEVEIDAVVVVLIETEAKDQQCTKQFVMLAIKAVKYLLNLAVINLFFVVTVLVNKVVVIEAMIDVVETEVATEIEDLALKIEALVPKTMIPKIS